MTNFSNLDSEDDDEERVRPSKSGGYAFPEDDDQFSKPVMGDDDEEDLDTPSFLRRKKDY